MKKASKILYCAMLTTIILCTCIVPCFAIEVTVESEGWTNIGFSHLIQRYAPTDFTTAEYEGYFSLAQTETIIELAEEMYKANAFNGARPVLITLTRSEYGYRALFWCTEYSLQVESYNQIHTTIRTSDDGRVMGFMLPNDYGYNVHSLQPYDIYVNGSVRRSGTANAAPVNVSPYYDVDTDTERNLRASWYYAYLNGSEWVYDESDPFCACNNTETADYGSPVEEFEYALNQWENANKGTATVNQNVEVQYQLDIPGIITSIPNGAKQFINNAFGFEIFGINVAGLLSTLIVVAIVAFTVKWLTSR